MAKAKKVIQKRAKKTAKKVAAKAAKKIVKKAPPSAVAVLPPAPGVPGTPVPPEFAQMQQLVPIPAPYFSAGSIAIQGTGNDVILLFMRPMPVQGPAGVNVNVALNQVIAIVSMSPQTAKDVQLALTDNLKRHEKTWGTIKTPYMARQKKTSAKKRPKGR